MSICVATSELNRYLGDIERAEARDNFVQGIVDDHKHKLAARLMRRETWVSFALVEREQLALDVGAAAKLALDGDHHRASARLVSALAAAALDEAEGLLRRDIEEWVDDLQLEHGDTTDIDISTFDLPEWM